MVVPVGLRRRFIPAVAGVGQFVVFRFADAAPEPNKTMALRQAVGTSAPRTRASLRPPQKTVVSPESRCGFAVAQTSNAIAALAYVNGQRGPSFSVRKWVATQFARVVGAVQCAATA